jgi:hypothetical protein
MNIANVTLCMMKNAYESSTTKKIAKLSLSRMENRDGQKSAGAAAKKVAVD